MMDDHDALKRMELDLLFDSLRNMLDLIYAIERWDELHDGRTSCWDEDHPNRRCAALRAEIDERAARFEAEQAVPPRRWWV